MYNEHLKASILHSVHKVFFYWYLTKPPSIVTLLWLLIQLKKGNYLLISNLSLISYLITQSMINTTDLLSVSSNVSLFIHSNIFALFKRKLQTNHDMTKQISWKFFILSKLTILCTHANCPLCWLIFLNDNLVYLHAM